MLFQKPDTVIWRVFKTLCVMHTVSKKTGSLLHFFCLFVPRCSKAQIPLCRLCDKVRDFFVGLLCCDRKNEGERG